MRQTLNNIILCFSFTLLVYAVSPQVDVTDLLDAHLSNPGSNQPVPHSHESTNSATPTNHNQHQLSDNLPPASASPSSSYDSTFAHGVLPDTPLKGPKPVDEEVEHHDNNKEPFEAGVTTEGDRNSSVIIEGSVNGKTKPHEVEKKISSVNLGVIIAVFVLATVFGLILIGVLKEHKYLRFRGAVCLRRGKVAIESVNGKATTGVTKKKRSNPKKTLHSLLGPSKLGFSRLRTYDSDSEEEEFPVFNRV